VDILLGFKNGTEEEALLLEGSKNRMRVVLRGRADTSEFRLVDGQWMGESGAIVEILAAFPASIPAETETSVGTPRWRTASGAGGWGRVMAN
jgi:hypothetical protein